MAPRSLDVGRVAYIRLRAAFVERIPFTKYIAL